MEVSSHALVLRRADYLRFAAGIFTNLTRDHLDFHGDMDGYFEAKRRLFFSDPPPDAAVVNIDDPYGGRLAADVREAARSPLTTFSPDGAEAADLRAVDVAFDATGSRFVCRSPEEEVEVRTSLPGHFNVENALAALGACRGLGVSLSRAAAALADAGRVPGRFEPVDEGHPFAVLVDYAHTPDSLENVLRAARRLTGGRLTVVFGCGGDRDREKRPLMGEIAARLADATMVTSDNPRSEDPAAIIDQILAGIPGLGADSGARDDVRVQPDRRRAIRLALEEARAGDTVVIAGKGHEQGQEFEGGRKVPFDDRAVAREELRRLSARATT